jgi:hypothetical protein
MRPSAFTVDLQTRQRAMPVKRHELPGVDSVADGK